MFDGCKQFLPYNEGAFRVEQISVCAEESQEAEEEKPEVRIVRFRFRRAEFGQNLKVQDDDLRTKINYLEQTLFKLQNI